MSEMAPHMIFIRKLISIISPEDWETEVYFPIKEKES